MVPTASTTSHKATLPDEIRGALGAHGRWKIRLHAAIEAGNGAFTVAEVEGEHLCDLGKFLHHRVPMAARRSGHWRRCMDLHAQFHKAAARALQMALDGKKEAALAEWEASGKMAALSRALTGELLDWQAAPGPAPHGKT